MAEFLNIETKEDSPAKVQNLIGTPTKYYIKATELNKIVEAVNDLDSRVSVTSDRIVASTGFVIVDGEFILNADNAWEISGSQFTNLQSLSEQIVLASFGMKRQVIALLTSVNTFYLKYGQEHPSSPPKPEKDAGTFILTDFTVSDTEIGTPSEPITGSLSVSKESQGIYNEVGTGTVQLVLQPNGANKYLIRNASRVDGFKFAINPEQQQSGWAGKSFFITNKTSGDLPLTKNKQGIIKLLWPSDGDMILPKDATAEFYYATEMHYVGNEFVRRGKKYILVTGNTSVTNDWDGAIIKVKANATITFPTGLIPGLEFDCATFTGATATLVQGAGVTLNSPSGLILQQKKMLTVFNDTLNTYEVRGEQTTS